MALKSYKRPSPDTPLLLNEEFFALKANVASRFHTIR